MLGYLEVLNWLEEETTFPGEKHVEKGWGHGTVLYSCKVPNESSLLRSYLPNIHPLYPINSIRGKKIQPVHIHIKFNYGTIDTITQFQVGEVSITGQ